VDRLDALSDSQKVALTESILDAGIPDGEPTESIYILASGRPGLLLPLLERKAEDAVKALGAGSDTAGKSTNPRRVAKMMADIIAEAGDEFALSLEAKLLKLDERLFDDVIYRTMIATPGRRNAFTVAYYGLDLGEPAVTKRILAWAKESLEGELTHLGNPGYDNVPDFRHEWGEALVARYGGPPTTAQWQNDPLAAGLDARLASAYYKDVYRFAIDAAAKQPKK